ncbi:hypothetical protein MGEO_03240 [Marivita geojedonensis]|uniref:Cadherin domain-containing protein n=1 Tax=Marivita geojedonensis TaxID=1123756 RepID=A0A1X4NP23_9RHOB|nr:hypothetical protein MGEO_03240 [Marivita geojedonensis]
MVGNLSAQTADDELSIHPGATLALTGGNIVGDSFSIDGVEQATGISADEVFAQTQTLTVGGASTTAGVLADNGGPVETVALLADAANPALDQVSPVSGLTTDAQGFPRAVDLPGVGNDGAGFVDLGAVELQRLGNLTVELLPTSIAETGGVATGTVTRSGDTSTALTVYLTSSDLTEATVPGSVVIGVGNDSASFTVAAVNDGILDGSQSVTITATANAINGGSADLTVFENVPSNLPPTLTLSGTTASLPEDTALSNRLKVADLMIADDGLGTNLLSITGPDAGLFEIDGMSLFLRAGTALDHETNATLDLTVTVSDPTLGGAGNSVPLSVTITDVNEAPELSVSQIFSALPEGVSGPDRLKVASVTILDDGTGSNLLSLTGSDATVFELDAGALYLKPGIALDPVSTPQLDLVIELDDPTLGSGPEDSVALSFVVPDTDQGGGDTDDLLIGTQISDHLRGLGGNDTLVGLAGDDLLDGGPGDADVAVFRGPAGYYTIAITPEGVIVTDRRADGDGSDLLIGIETLRFGDDPAGAPDSGTTFDLDGYAGVLGLTEAQLEVITQFYVGLFNRAPDALGLFFWATQLANGLEEATIAQAFINSPEAIALYGAAPSSEEIVEAAFQNFFDREVDLAGKVFWTGLLELGVISVPEFFTLIDEGARAPTGSAVDVQTLQDQVDLGLYFAAINGLSDVPDATTALATYDLLDRITSLREAKDLIDGWATEAGEPDSDTFIIQLAGVIDNPFDGFA